MVRRERTSLREPDHHVDFASHLLLDEGSDGRNTRRHPHAVARNVPAGVKRQLTGLPGGRAVPPLAQLVAPDRGECRIAGPGRGVRRVREEEIGISTECRDIVRELQLHDGAIRPEAVQTEHPRLPPGRLPGRPVRSSR